MSNDNAWCPENDLVWIMEQVERRACFMVEENRKLHARLAEVEAQRDGLRNKLTSIEAQYIYVYNSGYCAGHHDTVEGWYVDIHHSDMASYHAEEVAELREALAKLEEK